MIAWVTLPMMRKGLALAPKMFYRSQTQHGSWVKYLIFNWGKYKPRGLGYAGRWVVVGW